MKLCEHLIIKLMMFCLLVGVVLLSGAPPVVAQNVNIPDANLRKAINKALGENRAATAVVTVAKMKTLTSLTAESYFISDLTGLEKATNLTSLNLRDNSLSSISALSGLTNLTMLELVSNSLSDISAVSGLTSLTTLKLGSNSLSDISALSGLTNLTTLGLGDNSISDISAVSGLTNLTTLNLRDNSLSDISAVSGLTNLTILNLRGNSLSDISPLVSNTGLGTGDSVNLVSNPLSYPLIYYTHIPALQARGTTVFFTNRVPTTLTKVSGDAQTGKIGTALANPFVVEVKDGASPAKPLAGVPVAFVAAGGGTLSATRGATDAAGQARVTLTPGSTTGTNMVFAIVLHPGRVLSVTFTAEANVNIPDAALRRTINGAFGRPENTTVTGAEMKTLTTLQAPGGQSRIRDLTGLEQATNLTMLNLRDNSISNISAVSGLTNLTTLNLRDNSLSSISAVSGLTNLTVLKLGGNSISDISAVSGLTNLTTLELGANSLSSISAVSGLTNLTTLGLLNNSISDISPLVSNTGLGTGDSVNLSSNPLSYPSIYTHIPALQARGMTVSFTNRVPTTLTKVSGDAQNGETGTALANPFVVEVKDGASPAKTFAGVPVTFAVTAGGGTLSATRVATDATGRAQTTLTLGSTIGTNTVTATVTHAGQTLTQTFTATLNNVPPTFTSAATFSVAENTTAVGTVVATDADSQDSVTGYTITGGADSSKFAITNAGVLTFVAAPDYEAPGDLVSTDPANAAGNNEYILVVTATSGSGARQATAAQTLTITVTNVPAPGKPAAPTVTVASHTSLSATWTAPTNTGPAITDYDVQYRAGTTGAFTDANYTGTTTSTTLTGLTAGTSYQVRVRAVSSEGAGPWSDASAATTTYQAEDVDADGDVDIYDLVAVVENFGSSTPGRNDVDSDGDVDAADIRRVFNELLDAEAAAGAPALTHTAKTLQHYLQQTKARGVGANFQRGLAVLEELLEPFLIPDASSLLHNYPNPFNPETWIPYQLATASDVTFAIYSVDGTLVRTLSLGYQAAGVYRSKSRAAYWDGCNAHGESVASGVYFYSLAAGDFIATGKMLIRK